MQMKIVRCKNCNAELQVPNPNNEAVRVVQCPFCRIGLRVVFKKIYVPPVDEEPGTVLGGGEINKSTKAVLVCNGKEYPLRLGKNVVGRKASTSKADVQIDTDDLTMSRSHSIFYVVKVGDTLRVGIANANNLNPTKVGSKILKKGDDLDLSDGTILTFGSTKLTLRKK